MKAIRLLVLFAVLLGLCACASRWHKPEVSLVDVELLGGTVFEQRLMLKLRVSNPNDRDIPVEKLRFRLVAGDKRFASGQTQSPVVLKRNADTEVDVEAVLQLASLLRALPSLKEPDGALHYRLQGEVDVAGHASIPFDHPGVLDLARFEKKIPSLDAR